MLRSVVFSYLVGEVGVGMAFYVCATSGVLFFSYLVGEVDGI